MSEAISTQGTTLGFDADGASPYSFTLVPEVTNIGGPSETSDEIDVTNLDSTGGRREFIAGFKDGVDCPVECNYVAGSAAQQAFLALYDSATVARFRVTLPNTATIDFDAFMKGRERSFGVGEAVKINATLRITGVVDFTDVV